VFTRKKHCAGKNGDEKEISKRGRACGKNFRDAGMGKGEDPRERLLPRRKEVPLLCAQGNKEIEKRLSTQQL